MALTGLAAIVLAGTLSYFLLLTHYVKHWHAIGKPEQDAENKPSISVLVPARDEARVIHKCLSALTSQDYPKEAFEIIVIDDHSSDDTAEVVGTFPGVQLVQLSTDPKVGNGKKNALTLGIEMSRGEIIVTTDADCVVSDGWLGALANCFKENIHAVTGPVCYTEVKGLLQNFQALDVLGLMIVTGGGLQGGMHQLGNGANMAFRKDTFARVGGYQGNKHLASGDDLFLIQKINKAYPGGVVYCKLERAIVRSYAQRTWSGLVKQRLRWASKNNALEDKSIQLTWAGIWLIHLLMLVGLIALPFMPLIAQLILITGVGLKIFADYRLLSTAARFTGDMPVLRWFIPSVVINLVYVLYIGVLSLATSRYEWKDRPVS